MAYVLMLKQMGKFSFKSREQMESETAYHLGQTWKKSKQEATAVSLTAYIEILYALYVII